MAKPTRRSVLRASVMLAATAAPLGVAEHALSVATGGMASGLRRATFKPHVGTRFGFGDGDRYHVAVLKKVADARTADRGHDKRFRLVFEIESAPPQGTYHVKHPRIEGLDLFVSPIGPPEDAVYEAVVDAR